MASSMESTKKAVMSPYDKDKYRNLMGMVKGYDYPIEKHYYNTEDDYVNTVFRINGPKGTNAKENNLSGIKRPVLIYQHGLMDSAAGSCCDGQDSMIFFFADAGFDVWMNNSRGNCYSRQHKYLDPDNDKEFWNFSFHELGKYDQPALWNLVLKETGASSASYVGHSQGTAQMFAALAMNPEFFRGKLNIAIMLAPVVWLHNSPAKLL